MENQIKERFTDVVLNETIRLYGIAPNQIHLLDSFESFIFEFERDEQAFILRISHSLRRTEALILGEVDWINYLAAGGVLVARAVPSKNGKLVEAVEDGLGGQFLVTAFVRARGVFPWEAGWTPVLFETYGRLLGKMHALSVHYRPADRAWRRPEWDDELMEFVERYLPASETTAKAKYRSVVDHLHALPKEPSTYGMIHQDAHGNNFLVDEDGAITLFDFDDCVYSWYVNDVAIALFYIVQEAGDPARFTAEFMPPFLHGYRQEQPLDSGWLKEIPYFFKLREIELYAVVHRDFDPLHIDHDWLRRFMQDRKEKIERDVPVIDFDFGSL